jgi:hypothetical protein
MPVYFITDQEGAGNPAVHAIAATYGAAEVLSTDNIPEELQGVIPEGTNGLYEVVTEYVAPYPPLDETGSLATLLVVVGTLELADAAAAVHQRPEALVHEAESWAVASE